MAIGTALLQKKDKVGGTVWKPSNYRNMLLTTMEAFDLVDIQRIRHPQLQKYSFVSKALKLKTRIDFFLVAQNLTRLVTKSDIYPSVAPDHQAIFRLKCRWVKKGERPKIYFFNLEKKNYNKKTITELHGEYGTTVKSDRQILVQIGKYYSQSKTSVVNLEQKDFDNFIERLTIPKLRLKTERKWKVLYPWKNAERS